MHEWRKRSPVNILDLQKEFINFEYNTDYGRCIIKDIKILDKEFKSEEEAYNFCLAKSYGSDEPIVVRVVTGKQTKAFLNAQDSWKEKHKEFLNFKKEFSAAYGRKSKRTTCPTCGSSITTVYLKNRKSCPVCKSLEIISNANWKKFATKEKQYKEACARYAKQCDKCGVYWVGGFEWHY